MGWRKVEPRTGALYWRYELKLEKGMAAPDFELEDAHGKVWRLRDLRGQKVILFFYPADDTPGCTAEACDFRDAHTDFAGLGYVVLGVSPQSADSHKSFASRFSLNFPLLVDADKSVAERYGAVLDEPRTYEDVPIEIKRSTFVIDENGNIQGAYYGVRARSHVGELLAALSR
jgi:thioredoxin-dependent peroxiredoxin